MPIHLRAGRNLLAWLACWLMLTWSPFALSHPESRHAVEFTWLKSEPGKREALKSFIRANWFAMDAIAKEQGLMRDYHLPDTGNDEGEWNVLVIVQYPDERGYDGIAAEFEQIRSAHQTVPIDGQTLRDLGKVIRSERWFEDATPPMTTTTSAVR